VESARPGFTAPHRPAAGAVRIGPECGRGLWGRSLWGDETGHYRRWGAVSALTPGIPPGSAGGPSPLTARAHTVLPIRATSQRRRAPKRYTQNLQCTHCVVSLVVLKHNRGGLQAAKFAVCA